MENQPSQRNPRMSASPQRDSLRAQLRLADLTYTTENPRTVLRRLLRETMRELRCEAGALLLAAPVGGGSEVGDDCPAPLDVRE